MQRQRQQQTKLFTATAVEAERNNCHSDKLLPYAITLSTGCISNFRLWGSTISSKDDNLRTDDGLVECHDYTAPLQNAGGVCTCCKWNTGTSVWCVRAWMVIGTGPSAWTVYILMRVVCTEQGMCICSDLHTGPSGRLRQFDQEIFCSLPSQ